MAVETFEQKPIGRPRSCDCGECRKCKHREYMRAYYRAASIERRRRWVKGRSTARVRANERKRVRPPENSLRERARQAARRALKSGVLVNRPCERCGNPSVQLHHEDYAHRLDVMWLCTVHHADRHRERVREQGVSAF